MLKNIRADFPFLTQRIKNKPLVYFDNAATSQKPQAVIDALTTFYTTQNTNIHRGVYAHAEETTALYEKARRVVAQHMNSEPEEIIFTKGATEGINLVAASWALHHIKSGDEIVLTELEHHSNLMPWQQIAHQCKAHLKFIPVLSDGTLDYATLDTLITARTKLVAFVHVSNALGTHVHAERLLKSAARVGACTLIDASQSAPHQLIDVKKLDCDFLVFSGHKMLGPTGIGVLYGKKERLASMQPYQFGGGMVYEASYHEARWQKPPHRFEAGTPPIAQAVGLKAAIEYMHAHVNFQQLQNHEAQLCAALIEGLQTIPGVHILGPHAELQKQGHLVSFTVEGKHPHDVAAALNEHGICVRAGNHCAQPLAQKMVVPASVRASFYLYNTLEEVERFLQSMKIIAKK